MANINNALYVANATHDFLKKKVKTPYLYVIIPANTKHFKTFQEGFAKKNIFKTLIKHFLKTQKGFTHNDSQKHILLKC